MTLGGLFRQDCLGHGQKKFRAPEGVPKYTKKAKCARGVKTHVHGASPPHGTFDSAPQNCVPPKIAQKGRFLAQISVSDQNSKEFLKNLKYFLGSGPIFEKKVCKKKGQKRGQNRVFWFLGLFYPILPYFPSFTIFRAASWVRRLNLGLRAKPRGLKAARRWEGD